MITLQVKQYVERSVLCWLATVSELGEPNVSPKEMFLVGNNGHLLIANIASPHSVRNIKTNPKVCVSFIDIFVQKGYKISGTARLYNKTHSEFDIKSCSLMDMAGSAFPINDVIEIKAEAVQPIIAPSYWLYPDTNEQQKTEEALKTYGVVKP